MEHAARALGAMQLALEPPRLRDVSASETSPPLTITLEVTDPEVVAELRRHPDPHERGRHALAALRVGVLALRAAGGQIDVSTIREAGGALVSEVREILSARVTEMNDRVAATLTQYLDPQNGALPQRIHSLVRQDGELERVLRSHVGADDSMLARSLAAPAPWKAEGSPLFRLLSPTDGAGLRVQLETMLAEALTEQRNHILRRVLAERERLRALAPLRRVLP